MDLYSKYMNNEGYELLRKAFQLSDEESLNDPEEEPYKSKYEAKDILLKLIAKIQEFPKDENSDKFVLHWLDIYLEIKVAIIDEETEEKSEAERRLLRCYESLKDFKYTCMAGGLYLMSLNELGILMCGRRHVEKALKYLLLAEDFYVNYPKEQNEFPFCDKDFCQLEPLSADKREKSFEDAHTHTLYYIAQSYGMHGDTEKSARYCHSTLQRQLSLGTYVAHDWALHAATMSQYYVTCDQWFAARHCLLCAERMLTEVDDKIDDHADGRKMDDLARSRADLYRCWVKYARALLQCSSDAFYIENEPCGKLKERNPLPSTEEKDEIVPFDLDISTVECKISCEPAQTFEDARLIFLRAQEWANEAKKYYVLDGHCSDYVEIMQDHSRLFQYLANFEVEIDRKCKMHKRRLDMLLLLEKELSWKHYLLVCRQLVFEIAEVYNTMVDLKVTVMREKKGEGITKAAVKKINSLIIQGISFFRRFVTSFGKPGVEEIVEQFPDNDVRPVLVAMLYLGRLHGKIIALDVKERIAEQTKSLSYYQFILDYVSKYPDVESKVQSEVDICREMCVLLPAKLDKLRSRIGNDSV